MLELKSAGLEFPHVSRLAVSLALTASAALALSAPLGAQEAEADLSGSELWSQGGCFACHGDLAAGAGDAANAAGPSLRITRLNHDELVETIACGRPDTDMPMFLVGAYTEFQCYEVPLGEVPENVADLSQFTMEEVEALVAFLEEYAVGKTRITRENCAAFFGGDESARACLQY